MIEPMRWLMPFGIVINLFNLPLSYGGNHPACQKRQNLHLGETCCSSIDYVMLQQIYAPSSCLGGTLINHARLSCEIKTESGEPIQGVLYTCEQTNSLSCPDQDPQETDLFTLIEQFSSIHLKYFSQSAFEDLSLKSSSFTFESSFHFRSPEDLARLKKLEGMSVEKVYSFHTLKDEINQSENTHKIEIGPLRHPILDGHNSTFIDISSFGISLTQDKFNEKNKKRNESTMKPKRDPKFVVGDAFQLLQKQHPESANVIFAAGINFDMERTDTEAKIRQALGAVHQVLTPGGKFYYLPMDEFKSLDHDPLVEMSHCVDVARELGLDVERIQINGYDTSAPGKTDGLVFTKRKQKP